MILNRNNLTALFVALKTTFSNAFDAAPSQWDQVATLVPSTTRTNDYAWLDRFPRLKKWVGDKVVKALTQHSYTLTNDSYEATVEVDRDDIEDDQIGIYAPQAQDAGFSAKQWPDELVFEALNEAFKAKCYDGQPFISDKHPNGKDKDGKDVVVSNLGSAKLSAASVADAQKSYGAARTALRRMKDVEGRPLNVQPVLLVVPPALEDTANALMTAERLDDGKANIYKGTAKVLVVPWLTSDTAWFLMDTTRAIKPLIFQQRKKPIFVSQQDMNNPDVFNRKKLKFGAEARGAAGYGLWQMIYGSTGTA
ncbi:Mu-like prophage major head subunit gpT family protein [Trabulsiella odontotermitis]|uniref:Head protein n=1 Tax=Trabulsiella odontotermitis TaxID=379893 RepID=A0A0L0GQ81_9ENTR|nr:Mu-like prophage major head subunit gpT family protein [Trabulsiella odontotermitis]KNC91107.1 head protein [Trabulsiella odontotermitis]